MQKHKTKTRIFKYYDIAVSNISRLLANFVFFCVDKFSSHFCLALELLNENKIIIKIKQKQEKHVRYYYYYYHLLL